MKSLKHEIIKLTKFDQDFYNYLGRPVEMNVYYIVKRRVNWPTNDVLRIGIRSEIIDELSDSL